MREIRMEVASYEEAWEICESRGWVFDKVYLGRSSNLGKLMLLAYDSSLPEVDIDIEGQPDYEIPKIIPGKPKRKVSNSLTGENLAKYAVATRIDNGTLLFWSKSTKDRVTFNYDMAKLMGYDEARKKAFFMSRHGRYNWFPMKIK